MPDDPTIMVEEAALIPEGVRKVIHVDMDAFFASVEQRDDPSLKGRPVAVGGQGRRGVVAAASYEARTFGVRSAMPGFKARMLCPSLVFVKSRMDVYRSVSAQIREIFNDYTDLVEPLSLDEAYLDVTCGKTGHGSATAVAKEIKLRILEATGLTASAGVSYNKFLAKLASDENKPDGLFVITPSMGPDYVAGLPVGRFHSIGPVTEKRMNAMGVFSGADLRERSLGELERVFGSHASYYHSICRGIDHRPVTPDRIRKSVGAEHTMETNLVVLEDLRQVVLSVAQKAWTRSEGVGRTGRTVVLKVKYADFEQVTRTRSMSTPVETVEELGTVAWSLLEGLVPLSKPVRLLGVAMSGLEDPGHPAPQLALAL